VADVEPAQDVPPASDHVLKEKSGEAPRSSELTAEKRADGANEQRVDTSTNQSSVKQEEGGATTGQESAVRSTPSSEKTGGSDPNSSKALEKTSYLQIKQGSKWQASKWKV
jgi:hypothetical protein